MALVGVGVYSGPKRLLRVGIVFSAAKSVVTVRLGGSDSRTVTMESCPGQTGFSFSVGDCTMVTGLDSALMDGDSNLADGNIASV